MSKPAKVLGLFGTPEQVEEGTAKPALVWLDEGGLRFEVVRVKNGEEEKG